MRGLRFNSAYPMLSPHTLTAPKERTYFTFAVIVSVIAWLLLAVTIIGIPYALLFGFFIWIANGVLVAHLRSEAVRVSESQFPRLYTTYLGVCSRLGISEPPALYVRQSGGLLNAFAERHAGRSFVVVYSDLVDALGADSAEMKFILGHEIGHLKSRHLLKQILLAPGLVCPLLGPAYRRSWETSCDRHGAFAGEDFDASARAMLVLSGGRDLQRELKADLFALQYYQERGFFISLHELASTYPTLSRRANDLLALKSDQKATRAPRNPFAYLIAIFYPGGNTGAPGNALIIIVVIGLLAAMAIPAFQKVREASIAKACVNNQRMLNAAFDQVTLEQGKAPETLSALVGADKYIKTMPRCPTGGEYSIVEGDNDNHIACSVHGTISDIQASMQSPQNRSR